MLQITIPANELYDEGKNEFIKIKEQTLQLEHSLVSLSKWESKWNRPFLSKKKMTYEETIDYIRCMTITQNVRPETYYGLTGENFTEINKYIDSPMSALTISDGPKEGGGREIVTAEVIYYWMSELGIPIEFQKWHLNKLITHIKLCNIKKNPPKKRSQQEIMRRNAEINAANRKLFNTKG